MIILLLIANVIGCFVNSFSGNYFDFILEIVSYKYYIALILLVQVLVVYTTINEFKKNIFFIQRFYSREKYIENLIKLLLIL